MLPYIPIKLVLTQRLAEDTPSQGHGLPDLFKAVNEAVLGSSLKANQLFSLADRVIILDLLKSQMRLADLLTNVPKENGALLCAAYVDSFFPRQKLDVCLTAALLIAEKGVGVINPRMPHWLCLLAQSYMRNAQDAMWANNPALHERLAIPAKMLTTEELERQLALRRRVAPRNGG